MVRCFIVGSFARVNAGERKNRVNKHEPQNAFALDLTPTFVGSLPIAFDYVPARQLAPQRTKCLGIRTSS